jgi:hypothetical protein
MIINLIANRTEPAATNLEGSFSWIGFLYGYTTSLACQSLLWTNSVEHDINCF